MHSVYITLTAFHGKGGYTNAPQCYFTRTLPVFLNNYSNFVVNTAIWLVGQLFIFLSRFEVLSAVLLSPVSACYIVFLYVSLPTFRTIIVSSSSGWTIFSDWLTVKMDALQLLTQGHGVKSQDSLPISLHGILSVIPLLCGTEICHYRSYPRRPWVQFEEPPGSAEHALQTIHITHESSFWSAGHCSRAPITTALGFDQQRVQTSSGDIVGTWWPCSKMKRLRVFRSLSFGLCRHHSYVSLFLPSFILSSSLPVFHNPT